MKENFDVVEAVKSIVANMKEIEKRYFEANKLLSTLNERQNDLVHALELDITEEEVLKVAKALKELRKERRELKDNIFNLEEAKNFVATNYRFVEDAIKLVEQMERSIEWSSNRKYSVRDCEAIDKVIDLSKHDRINLDRSKSGGDSSQGDSGMCRLNQVEKFSRRLTKVK